MKHNYGGQGISPQEHYIIIDKIGNNEEVRLCQ